MSGVGEVIMRACLAKECCQRMLNQTLSVDEACSQVMQETTMQVLFVTSGFGNASLTVCSGLWELRTGSRPMLWTCMLCICCLRCHIDAYGCDRSKLSCFLFCHISCVWLQEAHPNDCGVLAVRFCIKGRAGQVPAQAEIECAAVHYSNSMGIGWCSQACTSPECQVLRQQISDAGDQRLVCTGCFARCDLPGYQ